MRSTTTTSEPKVTILSRDGEPNTQADKSRRRGHKPRLLTALLSLLALIALVHFLIVMHGSASVSSPASCGGLLRTTDYTQMVQLQTKTQEMGAVQFASQLIGGQPAAVVQVMNESSKHSLDIYVFGCSLQKQVPTLTTLFVQRGLIEGTATVSDANTLITGELDTNVSSSTVTLVQPLQENVYREYSWQHGQFVQITFPSLYPVTSRSEAEALQQQADNGQSQPWSDPLITAEQMAKDLFKWPASSSQDAVLSNDDTRAQVQLVQQSPRMQVIVRLERLVQHDKTGLWFVTGVQSSGMTLAQPQVGDSITSPTSMKGVGALTDGQTTATLFDHTLTPLSLLNNSSLNVDATGTYYGTLFYTNSVQNQPGLLLIQSLPPNGSNEAGQLLLTRVILG